MTPRSPTAQRHGVVAVLGGDQRENVIAAAFRDAGWTVRCYGTPATAEIADHVAPSLEAALADADVIVCPAPGIGVDHSLYAPHATIPIRLEQRHLERTGPGATLFVGAAPDWLRELAAACGLRLEEFTHDDALQVAHAIPTAEGVIALTVQEWERTINGATALITGYGRIAVLLARILRTMGAATTVAARRPEIRARAAADGHRTCDTREGSLRTAIATADVLYTTAPGQIVTRPVLEAAPAGVLAVDIASPPGGLDHTAATDLGLRLLWARGQAATAPRHSGLAQYQVMQAALGSAGTPRERR